MRTTVKNFYGREVEVPFLFRGVNLYISHPIIRELFSQPEVVANCINKRIKLRSKGYVNVDWTKAVEKFIRLDDVKTAVRLLDAVLKA